MSSRSRLPFCGRTLNKRANDVEDDDGTLIKLQLNIPNCISPSSSFDYASARCAPECETENPEPLGTLSGSRYVLNYNKCLIYALSAEIENRDGCSLAGHVCIRKLTEAWLGLYHWKQVGLQNGDRNFDIMIAWTAYH